MRVTVVAQESGWEHSSSRAAAPYGRYVRARRWLAECNASIASVLDRQIIDVLEVRRLRGVERAGLRALAEIVQIPQGGRALRTSRRAVGGGGVELLIRHTYLYRHVGFGAGQPARRWFERHRASARVRSALTKVPVTVVVSTLVGRGMVFLPRRHEAAASPESTHVSVAIFVSVNTLYCVRDFAVAIDLLTVTPPAGDTVI